MKYLLFFIPLLAAAIGWITVRAAVWFLFHPARPKKIAGFRVQGIYPAQSQLLAARIGEAISRANAFKSIEQKIGDPANLEKITPLIEQHIDDFLRNRLKTEMPMIAMFVGDKTIARLKEAFLNEVQTLFPQVMTAYASGLKKDLDITGILLQQMEKFPPQEAEKVFLRVLSRELRTASLAGACIGLIIGLIQLGIVLLILGKTW